MSEPDGVGEVDRIAEELSRVRKLYEDSVALARSTQEGLTGEMVEVFTMSTLMFSFLRRNLAELEAKLAKAKEGKDDEGIRG